MTRHNSWHRESKRRWGLYQSRFNLRNGLPAPKTRKFVIVLLLLYLCSLHATKAALAAPNLVPTDASSAKDNSSAQRADEPAIASPNVPKWSIFSPNVLSILAFAISLYTLWATQLRPFQPIFTFSNPWLRFYRITHRCDGTPIESAHWIASINMAVSVCNVGSRAGRIVDFRIVFHGSKRNYTFYPQWVIDYSKFQTADDRRGWLSQAVVAEWSDQLLLPKTSNTYHLVFERSGMGRIDEDEFCVSTEYYYKGKWRQHEACTFRVDAWTKEELEKGSGFAVGGCSTHRVYDNFDEEDDRNELQASSEMTPGAAPASPSAG